jgi:membrane protein implicated in regulation of membrane protease activity
MEINPSPTTRALGVTILAISLIVAAALLSGLLAAVMHAIPTAAEPTGRLLVPLAWAVAAMLMLTLVMLVLLAVRALKAVYRPPQTPTHTPYVDAWSLAGQRFHLEEDSSENDSSKDDGPDENSPDDDKPSAN